MEIVYWGVLIIKILCTKIIMRTYIIFIALVMAALQAQAQTKGKYSFNKSRIYQTATTWIDHVEYDNGLGALPGAIVGGLLCGYGLSYASGKLTESTINYMNK